MILNRMIAILVLALSTSWLNAQSLEFKKLHKKVNFKGQVTASSFLIEKGKSVSAYEPQKLYDSKRKTYWCTSKNQGIGENLYIPFWNGFEYTYEHYSNQKDQFIIFSLNNGYGGNSDLYLKNSRIKKVRIDIQEMSTTPVSYEQESTAEFPIRILRGPTPNSIHEILVRDEPIEQLHEIKIKLNVPKDDAKYGQPDLFFNVTILEVYPGSQYKDLCVSEMSFYNKGLIPKYAD
ncbi:hypothetical protein EHQ23_08115 [Leptospira bourretii]|uniref:NAD glycohydrolase translocation F5/8 type C domain-containing protein n=1 Tax=Leptospira bourretii TaxID=2484962 RepID=A0A4R9IS72_9LEPT|nr:hypothetical protein [Leptospira bourretii]TGK86212.1 hypothetical protein EHQ23_08115 [Leptospira bourretii]TGK94977.1 hypothetical protein EHQ26_00065 [Leptospira bourretii]TGL42477.1 hypothetical protein EHQ45_02410 [Leptospira bourretii]